MPARWKPIVPRDAKSARADAATARDEVAASRELRLALERQIAELNARETDRGLVVTLGDLLFATGKSDLTGGAGPNLDKLAAFLGEYPDRTVLIEGHTDSVGSEESNYFLSQRRADSVKSYLVSRGVQANRLTTSGLGQGSPVASNDSATGRQQNRRVEVIISNVAKLSSAN
jgi:outer membrane protein OmpA-like peptidoglycan-associated protein